MDDRLDTGYIYELAASGRYAVTPALKEKLDGLFYAGSCSDAQTKEEIGRVFRDKAYLMDTHTAVGSYVLRTYRTQTGDDTPAVVVSTASPYKFCDSVLDALGDRSDAQGIALLDRLEKVSGTQAPAPLDALRGAEPRFTGSVEKTDMLRVVEDFLK